MLKADNSNLSCSKDFSFFQQLSIKLKLNLKTFDNSFFSDSISADRLLMGVYSKNLKEKYYI